MLKEETVATGRWSGNKALMDVADHVHVDAG